MMTTPSVNSHTTSPHSVPTALPESSAFTLDREKACQRFLPLITKLANQFAFDGVVRDDLIQEGMVALLEAIDKFDVNRGTSLFSFLYPHIRGKMLNFISRERNQASCSDLRNGTASLISLGSPIRTSPNSGDRRLCLEDVLPNEAPGGNPEENAILKSLGDLVETVCASLSRQQRQVFELRFEEGYRPSEIADSLGVSRSRVTKLSQKALDRVKPHLSCELQ